MRVQPSRRTSVPLTGGLDELRSALDGPLGAWTPGEVLMHSPRLVRTRVRVWTVPVVVELMADGDDVRSEPGRRRLMVLPVQQWLPEVEGVICLKGDPSARGGSGAARLEYEWRLQRSGALPVPLAERVGAWLARRVTGGAAAALEARGRASGGAQTGLDASR